MVIKMSLLLFNVTVGMPNTADNSNNKEICEVPNSPPTGKIEFVGQFIEMPSYMNIRYSRISLLDLSWGIGECVTINDIQITLALCAARNPAEVNGDTTVFDYVVIYCRTKTDHYLRLYDHERIVKVMTKMTQEKKIPALNRNEEIIAGMVEMKMKYTTQHQASIDAKGDASQSKIKLEYPLTDKRIPKPIVNQVPEVIEDSSEEEYTPKRKSKPVEPKIKRKYTKKTATISNRETRKKPRNHQEVYCEQQIQCNDYFEMPEPDYTSCDNNNVYTTAESVRPVPQCSQDVAKSARVQQNRSHAPMNIDDGPSFNHMSGGISTSWASEPSCNIDEGTIENSRKLIFMLFREACSQNMRLDQMNK